MISIQKLSHRYSQSKSPALELSQWSVASGEQGCVLGPSGSGKTTLLSVLSGLLKPSQGRVTVGDTELGEGSALTDAQRDAFRAQHVGLVTQQAHFVRPLNMQENLSLASNLAGRAVAAKDISELAQQLGVAHRLTAKPYELSAGEAQRFSVARAVLHKPKLVLADEPTSALDDDSAAAVLRLLCEQARAIQASLIVVTHDQRVTKLLPTLLRLNRQIGASSQEVAA
jgi:putative ABC transport system ATP-binding protein